MGLARKGEGREAGFPSSSSLPSWSVLEISTFSYHFIHSSCQLLHRKEHFLVVGGNRWQRIYNSWVPGAGKRVASRQLSNSNRISFAFVILKVCIARLFSTLLFSLFFRRFFFILIVADFWSLKTDPPLDMCAFLNVFLIWRRKYVTKYNKECSIFRITVLREVLCYLFFD